ncbi:nuclear acid binding [Stylonychia lemnae]|uniref:Nuclear acid binding n=1 Tax=Stylonychia lemnae TaxID=5949 RepID=A0A078AJ50_STYLE|nr:nuclear acid binding [Stylonychia lemnae]|eukprot:CDW82249.1 nuclear acid binding [Stylonychia lemnae]
MNILKSQPKDCRTLWVGDVESWMDDNYLSSLFQGLGYGFVEFANPEIARQVLNTLNGSLIPGSNKAFKLNWATHNVNSTPQTISFGLTGSASVPAQTAQQVQEYTIYATELDPYVNDTILFSSFKQRFNSVISAKVILDPVSRSSKCYGFIKFSAYDESQRAIKEMNNKMILTKNVKLRQQQDIKQQFQISSSQLSQSSSDVNTYNYLISQEAHKQILGQDYDNTGYEQMYYNIPAPTMPYFANQINPHATLESFQRGQPSQQQSSYHNQTYQSQPVSANNMRNPKVDYYDGGYYQQHQYYYPPQYGQHQYYDQSGQNQGMMMHPPAFINPPPSLKPKFKRLFTIEETSKLNEEYSKHHAEGTDLLY